MSAGILTSSGILGDSGILRDAGLLSAAGLLEEFSFFDFDPILAFDMRESMLADGDVPAEALDPVSTLDNISTAVGANGDATQTTALNQGVAYVPDGLPSYLEFDGVNTKYDLDWTAASGDYFFATATADGVLSGELSLVNGASYEIGALGVPRTSNWQGGDNYHIYYYPATISAADRATIISELGEFTDTPMFEGKTNFISFLRDAKQLKQVDGANIDVSAATGLGSFAFGCTNLTEIDVSRWDTSNVLDFSYAYLNCHSLTSIDVSNWDTANSNNFYRTFKNCSSLTTVKVNGGTGNPFADSPCTTYTDAFNNTNLTQQSIDDILVAIESASTTNGTFDQSGGNAPSSTGETAVTALRGRGWTVTVTGGF